MYVMMLYKRWGDLFCHSVSYLCFSCHSDFCHFSNYFITYIVHLRLCPLVSVCIICTIANCYSSMAEISHTSFNISIIHRHRLRHDYVPGYGYCFNWAVKLCLGFQPNMHRPHEQVFMQKLKAQANPGWCGYTYNSKLTQLKLCFRC